MKCHVILRAKPEGSFRLFFLFFLLWIPAVAGMTGVLVSCSPRPQQTPAPRISETTELLLKAGTAPALWLATTDFQTAGVLRRLDLRRGELKDVLPVGTDVRILPDGEKGLFLLTSIRNDSVHILEGSEANIVAERALTPQINPQAATRDAEGRVWLISLDSNEVQIFSKELRNEIATVDLSLPPLKDNDSYVEPSSLLFAAPNRMIVSAARLQRGENWVPSDASGLAIINTETFEVVSAGLVDLSNPLHLYGTAPENMLLVGSGDLSISRPLFGRWLNLSAVTLAASKKTTLSSRILDSSLCADGELSFIEWIPEKETSCISLTSKRPLACEEGNGGYIFNKLVCSGDILFASYIKGGNAELWAILRDGSETKRIPMPQPIQSMTLGP